MENNNFFIKGFSLSLGDTVGEFRSLITAAMPKLKKTVRAIRANSTKKQVSPDNAEENEAADDEGYIQVGIEISKRGWR